MPLTLFVLAHMAALLGYAAFAVVLVSHGARSWVKAVLATAAVLTAIWSATAILADRSYMPEWVAEFAGGIRDGSWLAVMLTVLYTTGVGQIVWRRLAAVTAAIVLVHLVLIVMPFSFGTLLGVSFDARTSGILLVIMGLILVENMMRNLSRDQFWSAKLLGIGLLVILGFQFLMRIPEFLTGSSEPLLQSVRPLVYLMVLPLFVVTAVRSSALQLRVHSSRKIVFHTAALIVIGVLFQGAALAAFYVKTYGGDNAAVLSIILGFAAVIAVAVAISSSSVRSRLRLFISENFFSYKFDYRLEWNRFIRALATSEEEDTSLRVLRTLAETLDSPGGALWVLRDRWRQFMPVANWSYRTELIPITPGEPCLSEFENEDCAYLELARDEKSPAAQLWHTRHPSAWLAVPLRYRSSLVGVAVLNHPRAARKLDWEDKNLISLIALQLAATLVQGETAQALADARQLQDFNKRFAFIIHDTKNAIGQLSLLVRNVEQHGHDQEFRKDMILTLRHSVQKLQELLAQLKGDGGAKKPGAPAGTSVDVTALVSDFVTEKQRLGLNVVMKDGAAPVFAAINDQQAFLRVLEHVVTNATEATPPGSSVKVGVSAAGSSAKIAVDDAGPGMTQQFIANELFRPLRTTKGTGFGIGAYQAREIMTDLGGEIDVRSKVGEGTSVALSLPLADSQKEVARA
jgi:putative PEP-CTERM system histidine kinase